MTARIIREALAKAKAPAPALAEARVYLDTPIPTVPAKQITEFPRCLR